MSAARTALLGLVGALAEAVEPVPVALDDDGAAAPGESGVRVRPRSLSRIGRSRRDGSVLDLELVAAVGALGPEALELTELMLTALERQSRYTVEPLEAGDALAFQVRVPVAVRLEEPVRWRVREPMLLDVRLARSLTGVVLGGDGGALPDALVSASIGGPPAHTDAQGRFRVLVADAPRQSFLVEVRGATRTVDAATDTAPVVIRWE